MSDVIYWTGAGYYYPAQAMTDDREWYVIWTYRSNRPERLEGMGTPSYFGEVPEGFIVVVEA